MKSKVSSPKILNIVLCVVILLIFVLTIGTRINAEVLTDNTSEVIPLSIEIGYAYQDFDYKLLNQLEQSEDEIEPIVLDLNYYLNEYEMTIKFFAKTFDYNYDDIIQDLKERELDNPIFEYTNIGYLKESDNLKTFPNFEYGLIKYFMNLNEINTVQRNVIYKPYTGNADYVEKLIGYYSTIYENVDKTVLLSIGAAESGYYKVKFMLKYNNVYGGMSKRGLIKHNNIEQGVLSYVRLMSSNYYGKGLTTLESIGRVYCPVYINGVKEASGHWINLVNSAKEKYTNYTDTITIKSLINNIEEV
ncbi:MAG: hypothetical protein PHX04_00965 [Bacilli bacterium]|nr:hypothetical protein [Bacilli bacterium]